LNTATSAAVWVLIASSSSNAALIPLMLQTQMSTGDIASSTIVPAVPGGTSLAASLPQGYAYVNGNLVQTPATASHTFTASMWTYVFINADGTLNFQVQSAMTTPPVIANTLLAYLVETNGSTITTVVSYYALPATLRNFMVAPPNSSGQVFQTDTTQPLGTKWGFLPFTSLSAAGTSAYWTSYSNGTAWVLGLLPLASIDNSSASGAWTAQTLSVAGGGTGSVTAPTNGQIPVGGTSDGFYTPANITAATGNVKITNGAHTISVGVPAFNTSNKSANFNAVGSNAYFCTGTLTATLPDATAIAGQEIIIWNTGSGTITLAVTSAQTINGSSSTFSSSAQWEMYRFISDGTNWEMTKQTGPTS